MPRKAKRFYGGRPRRAESVRPATGHTFLIVVEGEATERSYLMDVRSKLKRRAAAVLVWHGKHTDPEGIVSEAIKYRDEQKAKSAKSSTEPYDQVWVVFDRERQNHPRRRQVPKALQLANANDVRVALSIPSFEFWLLLHFRPMTGALDGCAACRKELKRFIKDYEKADLPMRDLLSRMKIAMRHAAQCRKHWESVGGDRNPSTDVDKLLRELNNSARAEMRLF